MRSDDREVLKKGSKGTPKVNEKRGIGARGGWVEGLMKEIGDHGSAGSRCTKHARLKEVEVSMTVVWRLRVISGHRSSCSHRRLNPTGVGGPSRISPARLANGSSRTASTCAPRILDTVCENF